VPAAVCDSVPAARSQVNPSPLERKPVALSSLKQLERYHVERAQALLGSIPRGKLFPSESPDFITRRKARNFGIEVVRYTVPTKAGERPPREQASLRRQVAQAAQALAERMNLPAVRVAIRFTRRALHRRQIPELAAAVAQAVGSAPHSASGVMELPRGNRTPLPRVISSILIHSREFITDHLWYSADGGISAPVTTNEIQHCIDLKARLKSRYRLSVPRVWLLIVVEGFTVASFGTVNEDVLAHTYHAPFDGVALLDNAHDQCWALPLLR